MDTLIKQYNLIKEYDKFSGSQTSMATLYITPDKNLVTIQNMLADDMSSKKNIKTPINRDNTIEAVSNMC